MQKKILQGDLRYIIISAILSAVLLVAGYFVNVSYDKELVDATDVKSKDVLGNVTITLLHLFLVYFIFKIYL